MSPQRTFVSTHGSSLDYAAFLLSFADAIYKATARPPVELRTRYYGHHEANDSVGDTGEGDGSTLSSKSQQLELCAKLYSIAMKYDMIDFAIEAHQMYVTTSSEGTSIEDIIPVLPIVFHIKPDCDALLHAHLRKWFVAHMDQVRLLSGFSEAVNKIDGLVYNLDPVIPMSSIGHRVIIHSSTDEVGDDSRQHSDSGFSHT